jgi:putative ABC transport system permease protein
MNLEEINYSIKNLLTRKTRSSLTILSILIGIMAIFALVSFGMGIQNYVDVLADEAGADKLYIQATGVGVPGLDENFFVSTDDINFVRKIKGVIKAEGMYMRVAEIKHGKETKYNFAAGYNPKEQDFIFESFTIGISKGRFLKSKELGKTLLGYNYQIPDKIFEKPVEVGDRVDLNGIPYSVVGFVEEVGNPQDDGNIYLTLEAMEELYPNIKDKFGMAMLIAEKLRKYKDQEEGKEDFFVQSFADIIETFGIIITILNGVLVLIALISLIVASVNITNTMYTAVLERTKEIGIMKSIGARNSDILFIFVFESALLGIIGGSLGVLLGYLIASTGGQIAAASGYSSLYPIFPLSLILGCIFFAFLVGALSGLLPAIRASKLKPVDALRYE